MSQRRASLWERSLVSAAWRRSGSPPVAIRLWDGTECGAAGSTAIGAISGVLWKKRSCWPAATVGWAFLLVTLAPVLGILQVGGQASADRYTYLTTLPAFFGLTPPTIRVP